MKKRGNVDARLDAAAQQVGWHSPGVVQGQPSRVLEMLQAIVDRPRSDEETLAAIEAERAAWGTQRSPAEEAVLASLRKLAGSPNPRDSRTADEFAVAHGRWLAASDRDLAGDAGRWNPALTRDETAPSHADAEDGHTQ